jgi:Spherulation-specific family 4
MPRSSRFRSRRGRPWWLLVMLVLAAISLAACSAGGTTTTTTQPPTSPPATTRSSSPTASAEPYCPQLVIPAYFYSSATWAQAADSTAPPSDMILDVSGLGAGSQPEAHFQDVVSQARARGVTILGYISTVDGERPVAQIEAEVQNYRLWYGVTDIFLDRVSGMAPQVAYYQQIVSYIHQFDAGSSVWLNPGEFPDQAYMSIGDVVMVFEGTYPEYLSLQVPSWASSYPASKFAYTIYATSGTSLSQVFELAASRHVGHLYVTDGAGGNPYDGLPSYWSREDAKASAGCPK